MYMYVERLDIPLTHFSTSSTVPNDDFDLALSVSQRVGRL